MIQKASRFGISLFAGWAIYIVLLIVGFNLDRPSVARSILLWNIEAFIKLAGNGPILGYDASGQPIYEGTPVHFFFGLAGLAGGFFDLPAIDLYCLVNRCQSSIYAA